MPILGAAPPAQKVFSIYVGPHLHERARQHKGVAARRLKFSPGMSKKEIFFLWARSESFDSGKPLVCVRTACVSKGSQRMWGRSCMKSYVLMRDVHPEGCTTQTSTGAAPRPFERRPVPEGRKFRRWRQPEHLSERPQGASCAEGSDRRNFQAAVTGRHFLPLAAFHSFLEEMVGNAADHGITFQKWKQS